MGYYVNSTGTHPLPARGKAHLLLKDGAIEVDCPKVIDEVPCGSALICVMDNGLFEAAGLIYSQSELNEFSKPDGRFKRWLLMNKVTAHSVAGYKE